jgi:hypothetical protein
MDYTTCFHESLAKTKIFAKTLIFGENNVDKASSQFCGGKFRKNENLSRKIKFY